MHRSKDRSHSICLAASSDFKSPGGLCSQPRHILVGDAGSRTAEPRRHLVAHRGYLGVRMRAAEGRHRHNACRRVPHRSGNHDLSDIGGGAIVDRAGARHRRVGVIALTPVQSWQLTQDSSKILLPSASGASVAGRSGEAMGGTLRT
jgi:hypothetical protein